MYGININEKFNKLLKLFFRLKEESKNKNSLKLLIAAWMVYIWYGKVETQKEKKMKINIFIIKNIKINLFFKINSLFLYYIP